MLLYEDLTKGTARSKARRFIQCGLWPGHSKDTPPRAKTTRGWTRLVFCSTNIATSHHLSISASQDLKISSHTTDLQIPVRFRIQTPSVCATAVAMAFQIEVPGEAAPLTPQQVYLALQSAGSSQQHSIQTGTQQLQTWETQRGYYTLLQVAFVELFPPQNPPADSKFAGCLPRQVTPLRNSVSRDHPAQKWHRQILEEDRNKRN